LVSERKDYAGSGAAVKDDRLYLIHISESIAKIESYISGMDAASFLEQSLVQDAVLRNLQVLAESTQRLSDDAQRASF
jgi:uncharacterized protein with HEPN domain